MQSHRVPINSRSIPTRLTSITCTPSTWPVVSLAASHETRRCHRCQSLLSRVCSHRFRSHDRCRSLASIHNRNCNTRTRIHSRQRCLWLCDPLCSNDTNAATQNSSNKASSGRKTKNGPSLPPCTAARLASTIAGRHRATSDVLNRLYRSISTTFGPCCPLSIAQLSATIYSTAETNAMRLSSRSFSVSRPTP